jgi:hypothetical protein
MKKYMVALEKRSVDYDDVRKKMVETFKLNVVIDLKFIKCMVVEFDGNETQLKKLFEAIPDTVVEFYES